MHTFLLFFGYPNGAIWGNVWAMPVCGLIAGAVTFVFRDHIGRAVSSWWRRHLGHGDELAEIRDLAARAHRIAASTHKKLTGVDHPDAPGGGDVG